MRKFLWNGSEDKDKIPLLAWDKVCKANWAGGVGIRSWNQFNLAMGAKLVWQMFAKPDQKWVRVLSRKYLDSNDPARILTIRNPCSGSAIWQFRLECRKKWSIFRGRLEMVIKLFSKRIPGMVIRLWMK